ncbi:MAG: DUF1152 domain-containing protein [Chloroflexi bacterium AL-W]|nr:DUF1152 domain-containing protein [Chloroflexi bacterium AL-N1]NOK70944.1 DUF1152 domain-containing protein [Chloroflexi bacterium AL-N10]NOK73217.1 DUF1152 domain-containing protein [Chloroflexi bacterium AL-N5]NOK80114.1 DUF1152 domain-containing protein [Chloroflexi bacterium AL-W]NOK88031.1 DUF1152 domain-containing protein [Chloroflexi bacterium AL-N15]
MHFNLPILDQIAVCRNVLIAGMGGGFDVFCGLPIYFELQRHGINVQLANYSFSYITDFAGGVRLSDTLVGVNANHQDLVLYFPELHLSRWFREQQREEVTVWCFEKVGVKPLLSDYHILIEYLDIDGIVLIDGGVDSLMCGDEDGTGTLIEDVVSLAAVHALNTVPVRLLVCTALGAEQDVTYAQVFENIAALSMDDAYLGSCSLVRQMDVYQKYEAAVQYTHDQKLQDPSVINASLVSAVRGHFGNYHLTEKTHGSRLWISPLMSLYWFFTVQGVAERNMFLSQIGETTTFHEAMREVLLMRRRMCIRPHSQIPL